MTKRIIRPIETEMEKAIALRLQIKNPLVEVVPGRSISFISGNCLFCEKPWKYVAEIGIVDGVTKELTGNKVDLRLCEDCLKERSEPWKDRYEIVYERPSPEEGEYPR